MRNAEGLVEVEVGHVRAERGGAADADHRVEVGAVHVHLTTVLVDDLADGDDRLLEHSMRGGVGDHEGGEIRGMRLGLAPQIVQVDVPRRVAPDHHHLHARHLGARGVGPVGGGRNQAYVAMPLAPALVVLADDQQARVLALRSRIGLQRNRIEAGQLAEPVLELLEELLVALGLIEGAKGWMALNCR